MMINLRKSIKQNKKTRAQSFVEFALMLTSLMIIVAALVDFGRMLYTWISLVDAAQEAVVYGAMNPADTTGIEDAAQESSTFPSDLNTLIVATNWKDYAGNYDSSYQCMGYLVEVNVTYTFTFVMPLINLLFPASSIDLTTSASGPIVQPFSCSP